MSQLVLQLHCVVACCMQTICSSSKQACLYQATTAVLHHTLVLGSSCRRAQAVLVAVMGMQWRQVAAAGARRGACWTASLSCKGLKGGAAMQLTPMQAQSETM
jgi:hypothetical protein